MSTPVLTTKLFAPAARMELVARPRIVEHLGGTLASGHRLTVVSAPAGFGKTTALSDWLAHLSSHEQTTHVAWLSLDPADNEPQRLLAHLTAALQGVGLAVDTAGVASVHPGASSAAMTGIVNDLARAAGKAPGEQWVLVLDDYHVIEAAQIHEAVTFLVDHLPEQLHLVLTSRSDPPLPMARLRARGELVEVRVADLRFTVAEAHQFLTGTMGLDLSAADTEALHERTEGWIAGLQLAALSLRGRGSAEVSGFIEAFTGSHRFVLDYLADEVLARQPAAIEDFLLRTAILVRLTGPLCDAVTGGTEGSRMLDGLERDNLFVVPLDTERTWYRYHHLFADVLRARLLAEHPDEVASLHQRASGWLAAHGLVEGAVRHALAAEDFDRAAFLMEEALPEVRRTRQDGLLMSWIGSLPDEVVRRRPVLSVISAWASLMAGDLDAVEQRLDDAEASLAASTEDPDLAARWADTEDLRTAPATISVYRASLAQARGDVPGTVRHAKTALGLAGPEDHFVRGAAGGFLGLSSWAAGDVVEGLATFSEAVRSLHAAGNLVDELDSTVVLADMWVAAGRPGHARRILEHALQEAVSGGEPFPRATADLHVGLAELDRELDDIAAADGHLEAARILAERSSITENRHRWFVAMSQVRAARGEFAVAQRLLDEAAQLYRRGFYPEIRPIAAMKARLHVAAHDLGPALGWAEDLGLTAEDDPDYLREYEHLTLARLLLAQDRTGRHRRQPQARPAVAALGLLDRLHDAARELGREGSVLEIRILQALAHQAVGDLPAALVALARARAEAPEPDSYLRLYLDEGEPMQTLLRHLEGATPKQGLVDPLSQRELEVLRLLDSELSGPEIARELFVTLNTLRTHTKRIFTKLEVNSRVAAVRRAHDEGLL